MSVAANDVPAHVMQRVTAEPQSDASVLADLVTVTLGQAGAEQARKRLADTHAARRWRRPELAR